MTTIGVKVSGAAELALERWGFTGDRLLRLAARAARDHHAIPAGYLDDAIHIRCLPVLYLLLRP